MKTAILCAVLFISASLSAVDTHPRLPITITQIKPGTTDFSFVRGHKLGKAFSLQWSMVSNGGVQSFEVQSTYEDPNDPYSNWYTVGSVNSANQNIYRFTDQSVLPGIINYRIVAYLAQARGAVISPVYTTTIN